MIKRPIRRALLLVALAALAGCSSSSSNNNNTDAGSWSPGQPLTLDVSASFPAGTVVHEAYSDSTATVSAQGTVTFTPGAEGLLLLEKSGAPDTPFSWANATVSSPTGSSTATPRTTTPTASGPGTGERTRSERGTGATGRGSSPSWITSPASE